MASFGSPALLNQFHNRITGNAFGQQDKQDKRLEYIIMPSLQEYVLIEQDFVDVEVFRRSNGWQPLHLLPDSSAGILARHAFGKDQAGRL